MAVAFILFIFGLIIGSFLNVITNRYELGGKIFFTRTIGGRSHCPKCKKILRWYELIPLLSFIIQGRRCRQCSYRLSWQYPTIELLTGLVTAAIPLWFYSRFQIAPLAALGEPLWWYYKLTALWLLAAYTFITLSVIDFKHTIIPDAANIVLGALGIGVVIIKWIVGPLLTYKGSLLGSYAAIFSLGDSVLLEALLAAGVGALLFGGIIFFTRGKGMGLGDLKLVIPIGLLVGWPDIVLVLATSFIIGAVISVLLMATRRKSFKDGVPFGPFLAASVFVVMFFGEVIMSWYFSLL
jgi:leader peptidase (prepilin peptidase)/N-methyltransferase